MTDDEIAKKLLVGGPTVLAEGMIVGVNVEMPTYNMTFGNASYSIPSGNREVNLDIKFNLTDTQLQRVQNKVMSQKIRVILIDGDE